MAKLSCRAFLASLFALALVLCLGRPSFADNVYASIRGVVTDQTGAAVSNARLTATNVATGISYSTASRSDGSFTFVQLPVGDYSVKAEMPGFRTATTTNIHLNVSQTYVLPIKLEVGAVNQEVVVQANPTQVETTSMQLGTTVSGNQIVNMPLNGRNWTQLQQLEPGVVSSSDRFGTYSTNGAETQQNAFLINGSDTNDIPLNTPGLIPSPDAIGQFRMVTNTLNPEYGRNSGAIMNAVIKNGTDQFHGDGFEFYRDTFLDARSYFQKKVAPFHQNMFGGTLGGPVIKGHTFFFFSYQGTRAFTPQSGFTQPTVFSPAERSGDFSADGGFSGSTAVTPRLMFGGANGTTPCPAGTLYSVCFPNGQIPATDFDPLAVKLMGQYVPLPNAAANGYFFNPATKNLDDQYIYRIDENINDKNSLWFTGMWERNPDTNTLPFTGATLPGFGSTDLRHRQDYTLDWNHTFSNNALNEVRFGYFRFNFVAVSPQQVVNPTSYGFTGILPQNPSMASLPVINLEGLFSLGFSSNGPQPRIDQTYQAVDNFTKVVGHHTLKFGFTMERFQVFNPFNNSLDGTFTFNGSGTFSTGLPGADFLLGLPDSYVQGSGTIINARGREYYSYAQDQWKARHNLTFTLGTGWDVETPYEDLYAGGKTMMAWRPGQQSTIYPTAPVGIVYPGDAGINKYGGPTTHFTDFAPRVGFAYSPGDSTNWSVRGGFGLYYNRTEEELTLQGLSNPPFAITSAGVSAIGSPSLANPYTGWCTGASGPTPCSVRQAFPFTPPAPGTPVDFSGFEPIGFGANVLNPNFGVPRSANWNLTVERQLSPSTIVSMGYVGNVGRHLEGAIDLNPAGMPPGVNPAAAAAGCDAFSLATCAPNTFPFNPSVYGQMGMQVTAFNSNYNALQVEFNRHFSKGLQLLASYTWSRYFDYTSSLENSAFNGPGVNIMDIKSMYAPSANDAPQRLVVSYMYTLPFYTLTHHLKALTDGWNLVGITTLQHGFPLGVWNAGFTSLTCDPNINFYACPDRANRNFGTPLAIGNPRSYSINGKPNYWFNPKAFSMPAPGAGVGDASRNPLYGPGINNWDMALIKDIHITEAKYFELRLETFDTFNHANFAQPNRILGSSNFGRIQGVIAGTTQGSGRVVQLGGKFYF